MRPDSDPPLPRPPDDPERLRRLREEAMDRIKEEEHASPAPVYGGPAPVYGGPPGPGGPAKRKWTRRGLLLALVGAVAAIIAWLMRRRPEGPHVVVYGGPPRPEP